MSNLFDAEQAVIGAVMLTGTAGTFYAVSDMIKADDFTDHRHRLLWAIFGELVNRNSPIDPVTVGTWAEENQISELMGSSGSGYILDLANNTPSAASVRTYAEIVAKRSRMRDLREIGRRLAEAGENEDAVEVAARVTSDLLNIAGQRAVTVQTWRQAMAGAYTGMRAAYEAHLSGVELPGVLRTPWKALNDIIISMRPGDFWVFAARPSMGKTAVALNLILHCARTVRVLVFSMEMTASQLAVRAIAIEAQVPIVWMREPNDQDEYWGRVSTAIRDQRDLPITVDEEPRLTIDAINARARREHERSRLGLIVLDHTQLVDLDLDRGGGEVRHEGTRITKTLKAMAKSLGVAVIALSQLNRSVEARTNKRPIMADLREFGSLEQDADGIAFLYRDEYYNRSSPNKGNLEIDVQKNRDGAPGVAHLAFDAPTNAVSDHEFGWVLQEAPKSEAKKAATSGGFKLRGNGGRNGQQAE